MGQATNLFFMGKGGVGKSTASALQCFFLAKRGYRVLLVSLDPAHNQSDIFETELSEKPREVAPGLTVMEVDQDYWIKRYLKDVQKQINRTYSYLTAFNLEQYFKVVKHSPGLEEYALILVFKDILERFGTLDFLAFDMPPTALALKFFTLPKLSLIWIEQLLALRQEIIEKRDLITKVKIGKKEVERDKILTKIKAMNRDYQGLKDLFEDRDRTRINIVLNPDILSLAESRRIFDTLTDINVACSRIINNKMLPDSSCEKIKEAFPGIPLDECPYSEDPLIGKERLERFVEENERRVSAQVEDLIKARTGR